MFNYSEELLNVNVVEKSKYVVKFRITKYADEYLEYLKEKCKKYKTEIILLLIKSNHEKLLITNENSKTLRKKDIRVNLIIHSKEEKNFFNKQVNKNIACMLDELACNDKEFKKYYESKIMNGGK